MRNLFLIFILILSGCIDYPDECFSPDSLGNGSVCIHDIGDYELQDINLSINKTWEVFSENIDVDGYKLSDVYGENFIDVYFRDYKPCGHRGICSWNYRHYFSIEIERRECLTYTAFRHEFLHILTMLFLDDATHNKKVFYSSGEENENSVEYKLYFEIVCLIEPKCYRYYCKYA